MREQENEREESRDRSEAGMGRLQKKTFPVLKPSSGQLQRQELDLSRTVPQKASF